MTQEVFVRGPAWAVLLHAQVPRKPAIRKHGNWIDSCGSSQFTALCPRRNVWVATRQRRKACLRQDKENLITDPFQTVATLDFTIKFCIFKQNARWESYLASSLSFIYFIGIS